MDDGAREEGHHLGENVFHKLVRAFLPSTEDIWEDEVGFLLESRLQVLTADEPRIGNRCGEVVPGHLNLRDDVDVSLRCVLHDLPDVILGVEPTVMVIIWSARREI